MGLSDSLNHFTIFTQPPRSFAACLASGRLCLFTSSPGVAHIQRLSMIRHTTGTATEFDPQGLIRTQSYPAPPIINIPIWLSIPPFVWSRKRRCDSLYMLNIYCNGKYLTAHNFIKENQTWNLWSELFLMFISREDSDMTHTWLFLNQCVLLLIHLSLSILYVISWIYRFHQLDWYIIIYTSKTPCLI